MKLERITDTKSVKCKECQLPGAWWLMSYDGDYLVVLCQQCAIEVSAVKIPKLRFVVTQARTDWWQVEDTYAPGGYIGLASVNGVRYGSLFRDRSDAEMQAAILNRMVEVTDGPI